MITKVITLTAQAEPPSSPANTTIVYLDIADGEIKAKNASGNIEILK